MRLSRRTLSTYTAGLVIAVALIGAPASAEKHAGIRIDNFGQVNDRYYRGARPQGEDFKALAGLGVKLVIDLADEGDRAEEANARAAGMRFVRIPMTTHDNPTPEVIATFMALVNDPANQPVYVHCMGGRHRTGVMTAIYRMTMDGWDGARAFAEMKQYKFGADWLHPEFKEFVHAYVPAPAIAGSSVR